MPGIATVAGPLILPRNEPGNARPHARPLSFAAHDKGQLDVQWLAWKKST
jgi:hypothetical protein